ncbi:MAG: stage II sporulation protein M [Candidatus Micrarchaeota archaeon]
MVLEGLLDPKCIEENPLPLIVLSIVFVSISIPATLFINLGAEANSLLLILLVAIPSIPLILQLFDYDEKCIERNRILGSRTLARHAPTLIVLVAYFLGLTIAFTAWFVFLPAAQTQNVFASQINELHSIQGTVVSGKSVAQFELAFETIFLNNLKVLGLILVFSLLYGAGAVFIIIWNASIIGVFLGSIAKEQLIIGAQGAAITGLSVGAAGLIPHGFFELLAYLTAALAGGILSSSIVRKQFGKPLFKQISYDSVKLIGWSIVFLAAGALIESTSVI